MMSQKAQYVYCQWQIMKIQLLCSFATSDDNLFLSTSVDNFTDIAVMIIAFLIHMSVLAGQGEPVSFSTGKVG